MKTLLKIQSATLAARSRLMDKTISTRVDSGKVQVVRVTYPNGPLGVVEPVGGWMSASKVCEHLAAMQ